MSIQSTGRMAMVFPFAFFLLLVGCSDPLPRQTPSETRQIRDKENKQAPTTTPVKKATPLPGCQIERLEDAEQAIRLVLELPSGPSGSTPPLVYKIDGDLATCKLEVFCKPDEESEETLVWSVTGDSALSYVKANAEAGWLVDPHYHHVLAIVVPRGVPKPDDQFVFSFSIYCTSRGENVGRNLRQTFRDAKKAEDIFPDSFFVFSLPGSAGGRGRPTLEPRSGRPGPTGTACGPRAGPGRRRHSATFRARHRKRTRRSSDRRRRPRCIRTRPGPPR